ncbi:polysaccharide export protein [Corallincola holothuriorum]|uniref:Polysaccharide export protein n=1 Tax=Corallincola holothuriorum TaxID=2282215 RepID=A0A368NG49_9GAMM|nr:polysaccharide export protein [Corallincola holothuriorum]
MRYVIALLLCCASLSLSAAEAPSDYRLGAGDAIRIHVFGEDELSVETTLGKDGIISYPYLGKIVAGNKTTAELQAYISEGLKGDYLINPSVLVNIVTYRPFYIYGEVKRPGGYPYQPGLTLEKAVAIAGGFTERASTSKFTLSNTNSGKEKLTANLSTEIHPGDTILVKDSFF